MIPALENHEHWMQTARELAENALPEDVPVGALLINTSGKIVSQGWNKREQLHDPTAHAEVIALKEAGKSQQNWRLNDLILYVTLEPCPMCASALLQARISAIIFGAYDPLQGALGSMINLTDLYPYPVHIIGGIQEGACKEQLQSFFKMHRR